MTAEELLARLRAATEDDVAEALRDSYVTLATASDAELLELFNRMLDVMTGEADRAGADDVARITAAGKHGQH